MSSHRPKSLFFFSFFITPHMSARKRVEKCHFDNTKIVFPPSILFQINWRERRKKRVSKDIWLNPVPTCIVYSIRARQILFIRHSDARSHNQLTSVVLPLDYYVTGKKIPPTLFFPPIHLKHSTFQSLLLKKKAHSGQMGKEEIKFPVFK
jgi:hypothetical protein